MYNAEIINNIKDKMIAASQTIAVAESVTSGHLQAALSQAENASLFFQGGITAYNLGQKCRHLDIDPIKAENCDCVSKEIAIKMALEVTSMFTSNWGVGITGYATPVPGKTDDGLHAFFAIVRNGEIVIAKKMYTTKNQATDAQLFYTNSVLKELEQLVETAQPVAVAP